MTNLEDFSFDPGTLQKKKKEEIPNQDSIIYQSKDNHLPEYVKNQTEYILPENHELEQVESSQLEQELQTQQQKQEIDENLLRLKEQEGLNSILTKKENPKVDYVPSANIIKEAPKNKIFEILFLFETDKSESTIKCLKKHFKLMLDDFEQGLIDQDFVNTVINKLKQQGLEEEIVLENLKNA